MATKTIYAASGGYLSKTDAVYATAHDAAAGTAFEDYLSIYIGQLFTTIYGIYRLGFTFDLSAYAGVTFSSVLFSFKTRDITGNLTPFDITVVSGADIVDPLVAADYGDLLDEITSYGSLSSSGLLDETRYNITLNAAGLAVVNAAAGGVLGTGLRSSRDINSNVPTGAEYLILYGRTNNYLFVVYPSAAVVTTQSCTNITGATATGNGNITDDGDDTITQHGHCWNTTGTPTTADSKTENGAGSEGAFTSNMTGLVKGTFYYVRAYAINSVGTSYGSEVTFTATDFIPKIFFF